MPLPCAAAAEITFCQFTQSALNIKRAAPLVSLRTATAGVALMTGADKRPAPRATVTSKFRLNAAERELFNLMPPKQAVSNCH